jgi:hypothetical protein
MKFITEDGKIIEGTALTERQSVLRDRFEEWLHEKVCANAYHGTYGARPCRDAANLLIPKLDDSACGGLSTALFEPAPEPEPVPEPAPLPEPVTVAKVKDDDLPF